MAEMHYCDRCKKLLGENDTRRYRFRRRAIIFWYPRDFELCGKCADEVWNFINGREAK